MVLEFVRSRYSDVPAFLRMDELQNLNMLNCTPEEIVIYLNNPQDKVSAQYAVASGAETVSGRHEFGGMDMDFQLSKEHQMARVLFRDFAEKEVKPYARDVDEKERFPEEAYEKFCKYGFMGIPYPKELGGQGCDTLTYAICVEEVAKACCTSSTLLSIHTSLCTWPIYKYGTEEQKKKIHAEADLRRISGRLRPDRTGRGDRFFRPADPGGPGGRSLCFKRK